MKNINWGLFIFGGIALLIFWDIITSISALKILVSKNQTNLEKQAVELKAISDRLDVRENDRLFALKLKRNQEAFSDISCGKCHSQSDTLLPLRDISLNEAIAIVRFGTERSIAGGMPHYKSFNDGKSDAFISDSGLKARLEPLYSPDLLKSAPLDKNYKKR